MVNIATLVSRFYILSSLSAHIYSPKGDGGDKNAKKKKIESFHLECIPVLKQIKEYCAPFQEKLNKYQDSKMPPSQLEASILQKSEEAESQAATGNQGQSGFLTLGVIRVPRPRLGRSPVSLVLEVVFQRPPHILTIPVGRFEKLN